MHPLIPIVLLSLLAGMTPALAHDHSHEHIEKAEGHDKYHEGFYEHLTQPGTTMSCCNKSDCRPVAGRIGRDGPEVKLLSGWLKAPADRTIETVTPDGGFHFCGHDYYRAATIYCVIVPQSGS